MRCWIELDASALKNNYRTFKGLAGATAIVPVLKSNAYGHGLTEVYKILATEEPDWLGVNYIFEAKKLRLLGYKKNIMVVGPVSTTSFEEAYQLRAQIFLTDDYLKQAWLAVTNKPLIHVKFDSGMSRQGFLPSEAEAIGKQLLPYSDRIQGVSSHFANVEDVLEHNYAKHQLRMFGEARAGLNKIGLNPPAHIASSASTLIFDQSRFDLVRIGISLYGLWPSQATRLSFLQLNSNIADLKPVLQWKTEIASIKTVRSGQFVGYGCTFKTQKDMRLAVLPVGYYEGYPRLAGEHSSYVLINGKRCVLVGRICMNMIMVDVSHMPDAREGDIVTLIGGDEEEQLDAATVASWANTIHYELLARLNADIPRNTIWK